MSEYQDVVLHIMDNLNEATVKTIETILATHNPFAQIYSHVGLQINQNPDVSGLRIYESAKTDLRRYNAPVADEVAAVIIGDLSDKPKDLILHKKGGGMLRLFETWAQSDPLQYPVIFARGELGWKPELQYDDGVNRHSTSNISTREFYAYR